MTIKDVKEMYKDYVDIEVYTKIYTGNVNQFHTDNCEYTEDYTDDSEVILYSLMGKEEYANTLLANSCEDVNDYWGDWNDDDKVLCIMIKENWL